MNRDSKSLLRSALSVIFLYHSMVNGSFDAFCTKLAAPSFGKKVGTIRFSDLLEEKKMKLKHILYLTGLCVYIYIINQRHKQMAKT